MFFYIDGRERTLDSPTDKIMMSLTTFADELERVKARQRTYDAMDRKARAGHVTGGACYGYQNVEVLGGDGRRSHVKRVIDSAAAETIRQIFRWCGDGLGVKAIAKRLNDAGAPAPRAQRGRSHTWAPSSVREALYRETYRGVIVWNKSRKRDQWGQRRQTDRPSAEWMRIPAPNLQIVTDVEWATAHDRLDRARSIYLRSTRGQAFGRPTLNSPSPYLLTGFAECGHCRGGLRVRTRYTDGTDRLKFYGCSGYHERGRSVCRNGHDVPMITADDVTLSALLDDVVTPTMVSEAIDQALAMIHAERVDDRLDRVDADIATAKCERDRLVAAIAAGGRPAGLLEALGAREARLSTLYTNRSMIAAQRRSNAFEPRRARRQLTELANQWRQVLAGDVREARAVLSQLLIGRLKFTPMPDGVGWEMEGTGTLAGLFSREVFPVSFLRDR